LPRNYNSCTRNSFARNYFSRGVIRQGISQEEPAVFDSVLLRMQERAGEIIKNQEEIK